jgi:hypothetical protein
MEDQKTFALQEYTALRAEILVRVAASQALERNVLISAALVGGFLLTHRVHGWERCAWFLPFMIAVFGWLRSLSDEKVFRQFGAYIEHIEFAFLGEMKGWERFRVSHPAQLSPGSVDWIWRIAFWGTFLLVTLIAGLLAVSA